MAVAGDRTYLAGSLRDVVLNDVILGLEKAGVTRRLVTERFQSGAKTVNFPTYNFGTNTITAADVAAYTDATSGTDGVKLNSNQQTATLALYDVNTDVYDDTVWSSVDDPKNAVGTIIANAGAAKIDSLLNAAFDNFSQTAGTSVSAITSENLMYAFQQLREAAAPGPYYYVGSAATLDSPTYGIIRELTLTANNTDSDSITTQALRENFVARIHGFDLFQSEQFTEANNATKTGAFSPMALGLGIGDVRKGGVQDMFENVMVEENGLFALEYDRPSNRHVTNIQLSMFIGTVELVDSYGVELHTKTS